MKNRFTLLIVILFLPFIGMGCQRQKLTPPNFEGVVDVFLRENIKDSNKTDIFLKTADGEERYFLTLPNIYREHYHATEYHNKHIYLIIRHDKTTGDYFDPNRHDELWRYDETKKGVKLFTTYGLDFRVSDDEQYILTAADRYDPLVILSKEGTVLHSFKLQDIAETEDLSGTNANLKQWNENTKKFELRVPSFPSYNGLGAEKEAQEWAVEIDPATEELSKVPLQYKSTVSTDASLTQTFTSSLIPFSFKYPKKWGEVKEDLSPASSLKSEKGQYYYLTFSQNIDITGGGRSSDFYAARGSTLFDFKGFEGRAVQEICDMFEADVCDVIKENIIKIIRVPSYITNCPASPAQYPPEIILVIDMPIEASVKGVIMEYQFSNYDLVCEDTIETEYNKQMDNLLNELRNNRFSDVYLEDIIANFNIVSNSLNINTENMVKK